MTEPRPRKFVLLDTSTLLGYYVPEAATNPDSAKRIRVLLEAVRHHRTDVHLLVPNIVVAEVFCQLARNCYSSWDKQVNKKFGGKGKTLDTRRYKSACERFRRDIHNGALLYQEELNRYHILALDLIAPVDKYKKFYRNGNVRSMGASDLLIGAMAMHLARVHGKEHFALISNDRRMEAIFSKAGPGLHRNTAAKLGLIAKCEELGFGPLCADVYPKVIDLARCRETVLESFFGHWPMATGKLRNRQPKA
jgi:hypothetical protein